MPVEVPNLSDQSYQDLVNNTLARIPVHTPEWTNFNHSDPGVTLVELFAFLTENLLYRANQIPERNHRKFLTLLGVNLLPAASARGLVTLQNERGPLTTLTLNGDLEVRAGQVPFRTEIGLDVLPVEAVAYFKRETPETDPQLLEYYETLYSSFRQSTPPPGLKLYETVPLGSVGDTGVALGQEAVDGSLWIALLVRTVDKPAEDYVDAVRSEIAGKTLSLGLVPITDAGTSGLTLPPGGRTATVAQLVRAEIPSVAADGRLPSDGQPAYRTLAQFEMPEEPGVVEITLPDASALRIWTDLDPLEAGSGNLPPTLEDTVANDRLITWVRLRWSAGSRSRLLWAGINCATVRQRAHVSNESVPDGTGSPEQTVTLSRKPVIPGTVTVRITTPDGQTSTWQEIDDLFAAGPEVPVPDLRLPPGRTAAAPAPSERFLLDAEAGVLRFGDGFHGKRPPAGARIRVDYDYGVGAAGNVESAAIRSAPALPAGLKVNNPVRTWGGTDAETASSGEKQITRFLQHRERLVTAEDFETITLRTPGVELGRVEVLPAYHPTLSPNEPGDAPGAVTLLLIPKFDPDTPDYPEPDSAFLRAVCDHLDSRRLITTEVFLRGPVYKDLWISVGIQVVSGQSAAEVREEVESELRSYLAPLPLSAELLLEDPPAFVNTPQYQLRLRGWPLRQSVTTGDLEVTVSRVLGVAAVTGLLLATGSDSAANSIGMEGLELPRIAGLSVIVGDPLGLEDLRGASGSTSANDAAALGSFVPVPVIPKEC